MEEVVKNNRSCCCYNNIEKSAQWRGEKVFRGK